MNISYYFIVFTVLLFIDDKILSIYIFYEK